MIFTVSIDWKGSSIPVGQLRDCGRTTFAFEYLPSWLSQPEPFPIDPVQLPLRAGAFYHSGLFGVISDCGPDRWGRILIDRSVKHGFLPKKPTGDLDYVLALSDECRIGALRFSLPNGPFLAASSHPIPSLIHLYALILASNAVQESKEKANDFQYLLGMGSPLGGARPKCAIRLPKGELAIAKFPKVDDSRNIAAGEVLALTMAKKAGINAATSQLVRVGSYPVSIIFRFEREHENRLPFISAASLLGASQGDSGSYTAMADAIRQFGDNVQSDLHELWKRMVFSLLVSNFDDHLRNHGFLMRNKGLWALSPAYDLNPVPKSERSQINKTPISESLSELSINEALSKASRFDLALSDARQYLKLMVDVIRNWKETARQLKFTSVEIESYASAFSHSFADQAKALLSSPIFVGDHVRPPQPGKPK